MCGGVQAFGARRTGSRSRSRHMRRRRRRCRGARAVRSPVRLRRLAHERAVWPVAHAAVHARLLVPDADAVCIRVPWGVERLRCELGVAVVGSRADAGAVVVMLPELVMVLVETAAAAAAVRPLEIGSDSARYVVAVLHCAGARTGDGHLTVRGVELRLVVARVVVVAERGLEAARRGVRVVGTLRAMVMGEVLGGRVVGVAVWVGVGRIRRLVLGRAWRVGEGGVGRLLMRMLVLVLLMLLMLVMRMLLLRLRLLLLGRWLLQLLRRLRLLRLLRLLLLLLLLRRGLGVVVGERGSLVSRCRRQWWWSWLGRLGRNLWRGARFLAWHG